MRCLFDPAVACRLRRHARAGWPTVGVAVGVGSIAVIQRSPLDALYSIVTGQDCSIVRLDQGKSYCRPVEPPPEPAAVLHAQPRAVPIAGRIRPSLPDHPPGLGDVPHPLTPAQEANRT